MVIQLSDTAFRILVSCIVLLGLFLVRMKGLRRYEAWAYGFAALVGAAAWFNFALLYHQWSDGFVNRWEFYHYQLGSKYFPELGYDGLYAASLVAQRESAPQFPAGQIRDLDTDKIVRLAEHEPVMREVRSRFSDERWREFVADHHNYIESTPLRFWQRIRRDHGYNPTPAWTFVARLFDSSIGSSSSELGFLASLDICLMALMLAVVFHTYGFRIGCVTLAIAGLGFGWRYLYIGSFLRTDWLAAAVVGICMLKRERFVAAGACLGYASAVRVFPIFFLAGPGLLAVKSWLAGERPRWPLQLAAAFAVVILLGVLGGSATGRGFSAWTEFATDVQSYRKTWASNFVGLETLFVSGPSFLVANLTATGAPELRSSKEVEGTLEKRRLGRALAAGAMLALLALATWRASISEAAAFSLAAIFALTAPASYYWIVALVVSFTRSEWPPLAVLALATAMYITAVNYPTLAHHLFLYGLFAWGTAAILVAWLLPEAVRVLRRRPGGWL